jgi:hypothetical protein
VPPPSATERELDHLAAELKRLETEYTKYFAGRLPRPPIETRTQVERLLRQWDRRALETATARFRLQTLQSRFTTFTEMWDRAIRVREEGRPAPGRRTDASGKEPTKSVREVYAAVLHDPSSQPAQMRALYDAVMEARRETGHDVVPFDKFAGLVEAQLKRLRERGASDVVFQVHVANGRPNLTAKPVRKKV